MSPPLTYVCLVSHAPRSHVLEPNPSCLETSALLPKIVPLWFTQFVFSPKSPFKESPTPPSPSIIMSSAVANKKQKLMMFKREVPKPYASLVVPMPLFVAPNVAPGGCRSSTGPGELLRGSIPRGVFKIVIQTWCCSSINKFKSKIPIHITAMQIYPNHPARPQDLHLAQ